MAWEQRKGRRYYYGKQRIGGRVTSIYLGTGIGGAVAAELQQERAAAQAAERATRSRLTAAQGTIDEALQLVQAAVDLALLEAGFHRHKGTWRRRRAR